MSRSQLTDQLAMMLGGHAAEEVCLGEIYTGSSSDLKRATEIARKMITQFGMSDEIGTIYLGSDQEVFVGMEFGQTREYSEEVAARIDREVSAMLGKAYDRAKQILQENREKMEMLVEALMAQETLNRAEFVALMDQGIMPDGSDPDKPREVRQILAEAKQEEPEKDGESSGPEGYRPTPEEDRTEYLND